jgi:lysozyme
MKTGIKGIELIKKFEGCKLTAYKCPAGLMTIGWGNTYYSNGSKVKVGDKITQQQADELLLTLLPKYEKTVNNNIKVALTQNQFDALVSFCWNCGSSNTLFSKVNTNASDLISWWQTHYITGGGKTLKGLVNRRKAESELYQLK